MAERIQWVVEPKSRIILDVQTEALKSRVVFYYPGVVAWLPEVSAGGVFDLVYLTRGSGFEGTNDGR